MNITQCLKQKKENAICTHQDEYENRCRCLKNKCIKLWSLTDGTEVGSDDEAFNFCAI